MSLNLWYDFIALLGKNKYRVINVLLSRAFAGVFLYRAERLGFLIFGKYYPFIRIVFLPLINLTQAYSNIEIHYKAKIGRGIKILHPSLGLVINARVKMGDFPTFVGGNCIGVTKGKMDKKFEIGSNLEMGANATIVGPLTLGNYVVIGAAACVTKDFVDDKIVLLGVPANFKAIGNAL